MPQPVPKTIPNQNQGLAVKYIAAKDPQIIPSAMARWDCASVMIAPAGQTTIVAAEPGPQQTTATGASGFAQSGRPAPTRRWPS